jgi:hypothetical protein
MKKIRKVMLRTETVRVLSSPALSHAAGGVDSGAAMCPVAGLWESGAATCPVQAVVVAAPHS